MPHEQSQPSVAPWERPAEPEHPLVVEGGVVDGDTEFMARCLFEELLRSGIGPETLREMTANPEYQALYALRVALGPEQLERVLASTAGRVGIHRFAVREATGSFAPATLTIGARRGGGPSAPPRAGGA